MINKLNYGISISLPIYHIETIDNQKENDSKVSSIDYIIGNSIQIMFNKRMIYNKDILFINNIIINHNLINIFVHASYQINIASEFLYQKFNNTIKLYNPSLEILLSEIYYSIKINAQGIIVHIGKNVKQKYDNDLIYNNMVNFVLQLFKNKIPKNFTIIFETTAGQKGEMCWDLHDYINFILLFKKTKFYNQIGICIDTCHIFQAGYDLNNIEIIKEVHSLLKPVEKKIKLIHLNDSLLPYNSHIDKHQRIGEGYIKTDNLLTFIKPYINIPFILETKPPYKKQIKNIFNL
jgi:deoxyribonuclease-4